ncbi:MAG TPA: alpha/beta hydrolase [Gemmatimonadaceae bacterium]|nr:alpha/beta hydrolase [Gemmatimonadaceae bacterium]
MTAALLAVALLVASVLLLWRSQERILFQPPPLDSDPPEAGRIVYEAIDGQRLSGYLIGDPQQAAGVMICFHGNADLAVWQIDWAKIIERRTGCAVFLAEYRGYMSLAGTPTYATSKLDARAAYDHMRVAYGIDRRHVAYFGHSLGSGIAAELAEIHPPQALLLQAPFTSAQSMARLIVWPPITYIWRLLSRIHFDTPAIVSELDVPVSVVHGKRDRIVPFRMGIEVFNAAKCKGPLLVVDRAGHNDLPQVAGEDYWNWVEASLQPLMRPDKAKRA